MPKTCIIIVGPTAVGKTSFAIELALRLQTEIISADSRQCFRELNIGVAKPSPEQLAKVRHYFINSHSVTDTVNASVFEAYALDAAAEIFASNDTAVMVGGTGLYIKAFCEGMDAIPSIPTDIREAVIADYKAHGMGWLQEELMKEDPDYYAKGEIRNPQRMMRALEVKRYTGQSILAFQVSEKKKRDFNIIKLGLNLPREQLYRNIHSRVDQMIADGLVDEVKAVASYEHLNALQTVGYSEIFQYLHHTISLAEAIEEIKKNTRHYAKRQLTWFSKDQDIHWLPRATIEAASSILSNRG